MVLGRKPFIDILIVTVGQREKEKIIHACLLKVMGGSHFETLQCLGY